MTEPKSPRVIREKTSRLTEGRIACALVLDRGLSSDELARFYRTRAEKEPLPIRFEIEDRVVRFECDRERETSWRLAFERYLARLDERTPRTTLHPDAGIRAKAGLRKLHLG